MAALAPVGLNALAVALPVLSVIGADPDFLVAHQARPAEIVLLALILCGALPAAWVGLYAAAVRIVPSGAQRLLWAQTALLSALLALPALKRLEALPGWTIIPLGLLGGALAATTHARYRGMRQFLAALSIATIVVPAAFLLNGAILKLLRSDSTVAPAVVVGGSPESQRRNGPIVLVVFDELPLASLLDPDGRLDAARYPNFARLARRAIWYRNATSVADTTQVAMPAILTGNYPDLGRLAIAADYPDSIFSLLAPFYEMRVFESSTAICPRSVCRRSAGDADTTGRMTAMLGDLGAVYLHMLAPPRLAKKLPNVTETWKNFWRPRVGSGDGGDGRAGLFRRFVASIERTERPRFYFSHVMLPHAPWEYLPSGQRYSHAGAIPGLLANRYWGPDRAAVAPAHQRHLLQVQFVDRLVGELLDQLEQAGLFDDALIVVTSDHGASFAPLTPRRDLTRASAETILRVPLFAKLPDQAESIVSEANVETIDILPLIADVAGLPLPSAADGRSPLNRSTDKRMKVGIGKALNELLLFDGSLRLVRAVDEDCLAEVRSGLAAGRTPSGRCAGHNVASAVSAERLSPRPEAALTSTGGPLAPTEYGELIGRSVSGFETGQTQSTIRIDDAATFAHLDPQTSASAALITGQLTQPEKSTEARVLAIAINGTIRAIAREYTVYPGLGAFSAIVPGGVLQPGRNEIAAVVIAGEPGRPKLLRGRHSDGAFYALCEDPARGTPVVVNADGVRYRVDANGFSGHAAVSGRVGKARLSGWAVDRTHRELPQGIVVFGADGYVASGGTGVPNREAARHFSEPEFASAGFAIAMPGKRVRSGEEFRVFALSNRGFATELPLAQASAALHKRLLSWLQAPARSDARCDAAG